MNFIWSGMIIISILYAMMNGTMQQLSEEILSSSKEAIDLCIYMAGIVGVWTGMMKAAEQIGILDYIEKMLMPVIQFLFPKVKDQKAKKYISVNLSANILGLGWAATPSGLKAMKYLQKINKYSEIASNEMCTFLILNISSLQLIPVNIIAYRSQYGSVNAAAIVVPGIIATAASTLVGIVFCKIMQIMLR
jgi:spore maturation protein A